MTSNPSHFHKSKQIISILKIFNCISVTYYNDKNIKKQDIIVECKEERVKTELKFVCFKFCFKQVFFFFTFYIVYFPGL